MVRINRKKRRATIVLAVERILFEKGELAITDLTINIRERTDYDVNAHQVASLLKGHPRVFRHQNKSNRSSYSLGNPLNPITDA